MKGDSIVIRFFIDLLIQLISLVVIVDIILSFFMSPYNKVRQFFDNIVEPLLRPIRNILPPIAGLDFSPVVFIILLDIVGFLLKNVLFRLGL